MYKYIKRFLDFILTLLLLIAISPLLIVLALIVEIKMGHPFYFTQVRTTKDMKEFKLMKFRSMTNAKDENGVLLPDDKRRTKFGNWLRSTSLDELPELINILKGDMSIIGPRPLMPQDNKYYKESELPRFRVKGGLIPPEVAYFCTNPSWNEQLSWEADYGKNCSFILDMKIFVSVFVVLFKRNNEGFGAVTRKPLSSERS